MDPIPSMHSVHLKGKLVKGRGEGAGFTEVDWVKKSFTRLLGFTPFPGTLNLKFDLSEATEGLRTIREAEGLAMPPPEGSGFCPAKCFRGRLGGAIAAGLVIPEVEGYYEDVLEILAPVNVRKAMRVTEGDVLEVEIYLDAGSTQGEV